MLYDKDCLAALDNKLKNQYPNFNIQVFLHLFQSTTRPLGYPPFREGPNKDHYLNLIENKISSAKTAKNAQQLHCLMGSLYQIMICFCYLQTTLCTNEGPDAEVIALLCTAIEKRIDTTDEERCAEKSLLHMLLERPTEVIQLLAEYNQTICSVNVPKILKDQLNACGSKQLKQVVSSDITPAIELVEPTTQVLEVIKSADKGLKQFDNLGLIGSKIRRQTIIGYHLLDKVKDASMQPWISENSFLNSATVLALQERGKSETSGYISARSNEHVLLSLFGKYSKATKLSSADKFLQLLNNKKDIIFSTEEREALQDDTDSRLTDIYSRYKTVVSAI